MENEMLDMLAKMLLKAEDTCVPIPKFSELYSESEFTIKDAYIVQKKVIEMKVARGEHIVGKKIGLTSKGIREQIGVFEPDYGEICSSGVLLGDTELSMSELIAPRIEPEIAFIMSGDLKGPLITPWDVIQNTAGIMPALEIVDSRYTDWKFKITDTVADTASYARLIVGEKLTKLDDLDLSVLGMSSYKNGELMGSATGAAVMGNPINAVVWLANKILEFGTYIKKGEIVLSGSLTPVFSIKAGDYIEAKFDRLGTVKLNVKE